MTWITPTLVEICIGLENQRLSACGILISEVTFEVSPPPTIGIGGIFLHGSLHEAVTCLACGRVHLINRGTHKALTDDGE